MTSSILLKKIFIKSIKWWGITISVFFITLFIPIVNLFTFLIPGSYLERVEDIFGFMKLTSETGGFYSTPVPNFLGFILLGVILFVVCFSIAFIRTNKDDLDRSYLVSISLFLFFTCVAFFSVFAVFVPTVSSMRESPEKCRLVFDGQYNLNKSECYYYSASNNKIPIDINYCDSNIKQNTDPYAKCLSLIAKQNNDVSFCNQINVISNDYSGINTENIKKNCYFEQSSSNDIGCEDISLHDSREQCYRTKAISNLDLTSCESLSKKQDIDDCYIEVIKINKDVDSCFKLSNEDLLEQCQNFTTYRDKLITFPIPPGVTYIVFSPENTKNQLCSHNIHLRGRDEIDFFGKIYVCRNLDTKDGSNTNSNLKIGLESIDYNTKTQTFNDLNIERDYFFSDENMEITLFYKGKVDSLGNNVFEKILQDIKFIEQG